METFKYEIDPSTILIDSNKSNLAWKQLVAPRLVVEK